MDYANIVSPVDETLLEEPLRVLLYGPPKIGKTYVLSTWPTPMLIICTDPGGVKTLAKLKLKDTWVINFCDPSINWVSAAAYIDRLCVAFNMNKEVPGLSGVMAADIATLGLDSFTGLSHLAMRRALEVGTRGGKKIKAGALGEPDRSHYHLESFAASTVVNNLVGIKSCHFVMTAHEKVTMDEDGNVPVAGNIFARGTAMQEVPAMFDEFWHLEVRSSIVNGQRKNERIFRMDSGTIWNAGSRLQGVDEVEPANFSAILAKAQAFGKEPNGEDTGKELS